jgi:hypothetical protein
LRAHAAPFEVVPLLQEEDRMSSQNKRFCNIHFIDGESMRFIYEPVNEDETSSIGRAIQDMSKSNNLIFSLEGKLIVIPMNNVRSIEISPSPANLPHSVIKAKYLDK